MIFLIRRKMLFHFRTNFNELKFSWAHHLINIVVLNLVKSLCMLSKLSLLNDEIKFKN